MELIVKNSTCVSECFFSDIFAVSLYGEQQVLLALTRLNQPANGCDSLDSYHIPIVCDTSARDRRPTWEQVSQNTLFGLPLTEK